MQRRRRIELVVLATLLPAVAGLALGFAPVRATESAASTRVLSGVTGYEQAGCAHVKVLLTREFAIAPATSAATGDEIHITLTPAAPGGETASGGLERQALSPPPIAGNAIHAIELDPTGNGGDLALYFRRSANASIAHVERARSVVFAFPTVTSTTSCPATFDDAALHPADKARFETTAADESKAADRKSSEDAMAGIRKALVAGQHDAAIEAARANLTSGDQVHAQEAKELLGLAYEAKGARAEAEAEYQSYLELYPKGDGAERVRQRLATVHTAPKEQVARLVVSSAGAEATQPAPAPDPVPTDKSSAVTDGHAQKIRMWDTENQVVEKDPDAWTTGYFGSISTYYERNQGGRDYYLAPILNQGWEKDRIDQVYQNSFLSSFDFETHFERNGFAGRIRASGSQEHKLIDESDQYTVSSLYYDAAWKDAGYALRLGRQTRYTGGVLGRFDGGVLSTQATEQIRLNAVAGAPVERSANRPFLEDRYFYGFSADIVPWEAGTDFTLYFIDQRSEGIIDRQGIGAEARTGGDWGTLYASTDLDVHYLEFNSFLVSATRPFGDKALLSANFDFRRAPLVFTTNALQGQSGLTLAELLAKYSLNEIEAIALDRSAKSYSATLSYTAPLTEHLQYSLDGTWTYLSATEGSAGVGPMDSTGVEFYGLAQLTASDVFAEGDSVTSGIRYDDTQSAVRYMLELSSRYPVSESWRLGPSLRLGRADFKDIATIEYQIMPTFKASYLVTSDIVIDFELGKKWLKRDTPIGRENEDELLVLTGVRYDFHSD